MKIEIKKHLESFKLVFNKVQWSIENYLQKDKLVHFLFGTLISYIVLFFHLHVLFIDKIFILIVPILVALIKELIDKYIRKSTFDLIDILFTIISGVILFFMYL